MEEIEKQTEENEKQSFVFYRSFYEVGKKLSPEDKVLFYEGICDYGFNGIEPQFKGTLEMLWMLIKPQMTANIKRYQNGKKGGAPKGNTNAKKQHETTLKQPSKTTETTKNNQKQPNDNVNVNVNVNDNVNVNVNDNKKEIYKEKKQPSFDKENAFIEFWKCYPRKVNKSKAKDKFMSICKSKKMFDIIMNALRVHVQSNDWKKDNGQFVPYPTTWLNGKRWEDEIEVPPAKEQRGEYEYDEREDDICF